MRAAVKQLPRQTPWRVKASTAYVEHDGEKRHAPPVNGASANWYAWTHTSAVRTPSGSRVAGGSAGAEFAKRGIEFRIQLQKRRCDQLAPWNYDDIKGKRWWPLGVVGLTQTKHLTNSSLGAVPQHGAPQAPRDNHAKAICSGRVRKGQERHVSTGDAAPVFLHGDKLCARTQPHVPAKGLGHGHRAQPRVMRKPLDACGPSRAGA